MSNTKYSIVFIKENYFKVNRNFIEMLDPHNRNKQIRRQYLFLHIKFKDNNILVPFRSKLTPNKTIGDIGYSLPSDTKPNAGLDFRKILVVNQPLYIESPEYPKIPKSQRRIIEKNYTAIENRVIQYVKGYIKSALKKREKKDKKYKFSTLHNFHNELGIIEMLIEKENSLQEVAATTKKTLEKLD